MNFTLLNISIHPVKAKCTFFFKNQLQAHYQWYEVGVNNLY